MLLSFLIKATAFVRYFRVFAARESAPLIYLFHELTLL